MKPWKKNLEHPHENSKEIRGIKKAYLKLLDLMDMIISRFEAKKEDDSNSEKKHLISNISGSHSKS